MGTASNIKDIYTLSPMQEGMLFHSLLTPGSTAYFEQTSYRLRGKLDPVIVEKSLNRLFERHDILRTAFVHEGRDRPLQVVLKNRRVEFSYEDIGDRPTGAEKDAFIAEFREKDRQRSFDLTHDPLMRVALVRVGPEEHEFTWSHHHILMDGWCVGILIAEYFEIYNSYLEGREPRLPPAVPYSAYIRWLETQDKEASRSYWRDYLSGYPGGGGIPKQKAPGPGTGEYKNERMNLESGKEESARLTRVAAGIGVTVNTVIRALWGIVLGTYNGCRDVVFGAVVSGRPPDIPGVEQLVGLFINTIPVRITYRAGEPFSALARRVHEDAVESEPHHYFPLVDIQSQHPLKQNLFDHILIFQNFPATGQARGDLEVSDFHMFEHTTYDFNVNVNHGDLFALSIQYNADVYSEEWVNKIGSHFTTALTRVGENADAAVETLMGPPPRDRHREIVDRFNDDLESEF